MAAAAKTRSNTQQLRYVVPLHLHCVLLMAALVIGDVVIGAAGASSPPPTPTTTEQQSAPGGRRMLIGSRAPTCTYNECRGCRHSCSVQQVPVDDSDPVNSAYRYKCVCHI